MMSSGQYPTSRLCRIRNQGLFTLEASNPQSQGTLEPIASIDFNHIRNPTVRNVSRRLTSFRNKITLHGLHAGSQNELNNHFIMSATSCFKLQIYKPTVYYM